MILPDGFRESLPRIRKAQSNGRGYHTDRTTRPGSPETQERRATEPRNSATDNFLKMKYNQRRNGAG
jgi:hypothetical protein